jgi:hypothetical protein
MSDNEILLSAPNSSSANKITLEVIDIFPPADELLVDNNKYTIYIPTTNEEYSITDLVNKETNIEIPSDKKSFNLQLLKNKNLMCHTNFLLSKGNQWITFKEKNKKNNLAIDLIDCIKLKFNIIKDKNNLNNNNKKLANFFSEKKFEKIDKKFDKLDEKKFSRTIAIPKKNIAKIRSNFNNKEKISKHKHNKSYENINYGNIFDDDSGNIIKKKINSKNEKTPKNKNKLRLNNSTVSGIGLNKKILGTDKNFIVKNLDNNFIDVSNNKKKTTNNKTNNNNNNNNKTLKNKSASMKEIEINKYIDTLKNDNEFYDNILDKFFDKYFHSLVEEDEEKTDISNSNIIINDINLNNNNENNNNISNNNYDIDNSKFLQLKDDFYLLYTEDYLSNVQNDTLRLELELMIDKTFEIVKNYHQEINKIKKEKKRNFIILNNINFFFQNLNKKNFKFNQFRENEQIKKNNLNVILKNFSVENLNCLDIQKKEFVLFKNLLPKKILEKKSLLKEICIKIVQKNHKFFDDSSRFKNWIKNNVVINNNNNTNHNNNVNNKNKTIKKNLSTNSTHKKTNKDSIKSNINNNNKKIKKK